MEDGLMSNKSRIKAVRILVSFLIETFGDKPDAKHKICLAKAIIKEFPLLKDNDGEGYEAWYTPAKGKHPATGFLEERLRNVRKRSKKFTKTDPKIQESTSLQSTLMLNLISEESPEQIAGMNLWLKHNREPVAQVKSYMLKTAKDRATYIRSNPDVSAESVLEKYPRLIDTPGMIAQDFKTLMADTEINPDSLFMKWPLIFPHILEYEEKQNSHLWKEYTKAEIPESDDERSNLALILLPCILPSFSKKKGGKVNRSNICDSLNAFIVCKPIGVNLPNLLETLTQRQPFVLTIGDSTLKPEQSFVVVERRALPQSSLLKAIDVCFKLFYVLDISYPWECNTTWEFIQKAIFNLGEGKGKTTTAGSLRALRALIGSRRSDE